MIGVDLVGALGGKTPFIVRQSRHVVAVAVAEAAMGGHPCPRVFIGKYHSGGNRRRHASENLDLLGDVG